MSGQIFRRMLARGLELLSSYDAEPCIVSFFFFKGSGAPRNLPSSPTRRSPDLGAGVLAFAPAARFGRRRRLLGLEPGRDRLRLGPPLAPGRLLLFLSLGLRLDTGLGGVGHAQIGRAHV